MSLTGTLAERLFGVPTNVAPLDTQVVNGLPVVDMMIWISPSIVADAAGKVIAKLEPVIPVRYVYFVVTVNVVIVFVATTVLEVSRTSPVVRVVALNPRIPAPLGVKSMVMSVSVPLAVYLTDAAAIPPVTLEENAASTFASHIDLDVG